MPHDRLFFVAFIFFWFVVEPSKDPIAFSSFVVNVQGILHSQCIHRFISIETLLIDALSFLSYIRHVDSMEIIM